MAGMLLNVKVVAAKGLTSLIPAGRSTPASPSRLSRRLRFDLIPGREGAIVQALIIFWMDQNGPWHFPGCTQGNDTFFPAVQSESTREQSL